ncbi:uncharacterized protein isoform X2 [Castor canadensis]|uniref:Uncharacterized protein isoform X2 n=1 Tax=Castor canadensis TaxID=51338 RepID=A0AC58LYQ1_CASCN
MSGKRSLRPLSATHPDPGSPGRGRPGNGPSRPCWPAGQRSAHTGGQKGRRGGFTVRGSGAGERGVRLRRPEPGSAAAAVVASFIFAAAAATCQRERRKRPRQRRQESLAGFGQNSRAARSPRPAFRSRAGGARVPSWYPSSKYSTEYQFIGNWLKIRGPMKLVSALQKHRRNSHLSHT